MHCPIRNPNLADNLIELLTEDSFSSLKHLITLNISKNKLKTISIDAFKYLFKLKKLNLEENYITYLALNIYSFLIDLNLSNNYIMFIPSNFDFMKTNGTISLYGNPLKCPCYHHLIQWAYKYNVNLKLTNPSFPENPVCVVPLSDKTCTETIDNEACCKYFKRQYSNCPDCV